MNREQLAERLLLKLMSTSCRYLNLVRNKMDYGRGFWVMGQTYEEALAEAQKALEDSLVEAGQIHVLRELVRRQVEHKPGSN